MASTDLTTRSTATTGRTLTANATVAFVLAALVTGFSHEIAHAVAALVQGANPVVSPFSVSYPDGGRTPTEEIVTALAGPLFSLVVGLVLMVVARSWGSGLVRLFWMWLAFMGVMNFVGYCVIAPFGDVGDTGHALALLAAPGWVSIVVFLVGVAGQFLLARRFAVEVKRYAADLGAERRLTNTPWMIGTAVVIVLTAVEVLLLSAPAEQTVVVLAYSVAVGIFAPMQFIFHGRVSNTYEDLVLAPPRTGLVVLVVVAAALIILAAVGGVSLG